MADQAEEKLDESEQSIPELSIPDGQPFADMPTTQL
jgi:hypothetical protein